MSDLTQDELIAKLLPDEDRDYGDDNRAGVVAKVEAGEYVIRENPTGGQPIFSIASAGSRPVRGSGKIGPTGLQGASQRLTQVLIEFMEDGGHELVVETLREALEGGKDTDGKDLVPWKTRMDAAELVFERIIGRVHERRTSSENKLLDLLARKLQAGEMEEEREIPQLPEYTVIEIDTEDVAG